MKKILYLISLRVLANKILAISAVPMFSVTYQNDEWITARTSFNIILIKNRFPKNDFDKIYDAVLLLVNNKHIEKFAHHFAYEQQFLGDSEKDLYQRYIITREGLLSLRSNYYTDDWIFNLVLSKLNTLKTLFGASIIALIVWIGSTVSKHRNQQELSTKQIVVLTHTWNKLEKSQHRDSFEMSKIDTIIYLYR